MWPPLHEASERLPSVLEGQQRGPCNWSGVTGGGAIGR